MARDFKISTTGMEEMEDQFEKASIPNLRTKSIGKLENLFSASYDATRSKVHMDTGYLKASGKKDTHFVGDVWIGEQSFARHPGIFELALGDTPSGTDTYYGKHTKKKNKEVLQRSHPTGGHHFFNAVEPFIPFMEAAINDVFYDYFGKADV